MSKFNQRAITLTAACHGLVHVLEVSFGVVLVGISEEFGVTLFTLGILANVFGIAFGMMALPSGYLADKISAPHLLAICCGSIGLAGIAISLSNNVYWLGVFLFILGMALGIFHPIGTAYITRLASQRGKGFGYLGVGGNLGLSLGPLMVGAIAAGMGWRAPYLVFAVVAILMGVLFYLTGRQPDSANSAHAVKINTDTKPDKPLRPFIWLLIITWTVQVTNGLIYRGTITFLPSYLAGNISLSFLNMDSMFVAGSFTTLAFLFGVFGIFAGGYFSDKIRPELIAVTIAAVNAPALLMLGLGHGLPLLLFSSIFAFFYFMGQPVFNSLIADYSPQNWRGRFFGVSFFAAFGVGSFSGSLLGFLADKLDTSWIFISLAIVQAVGLLGAIILVIKSRQSSGLWNHKPGV